MNFLLRGIEVFNFSKYSMQFYFDGLPILKNYMSGLLYIFQCILCIYIMVVMVFANFDSNIVYGISYINDNQMRNISIIDNIMNVKVALFDPLLQNRFADENIFNVNYEIVFADKNTPREISKGIVCGNYFCFNNYSLPQYDVVESNIYVNIKDVKNNGKFYFELTYTDSIYDRNKDIIIPEEKSIKGEILPDYSKDIFLKIEQLSLSRDDGLFYKNLHKTTSLKFNANILETISQKRAMNKISFTFTLSNVEKEIVNQNKKLQTTLAEIGGLFKLVYLIFQILFYFSDKIALENYIYKQFKSKRNFPLIRKNTIQLIKNKTFFTIKEEKDNKDKESKGSSLYIPGVNPFHNAIVSQKNSNINLMHKSKYNTNIIKPIPINMEKSSNMNILQTEEIKILNQLSSPKKQGFTSQLYQKSSVIKIEDNEARRSTNLMSEEEMQKMENKYNRVIEQNNIVFDFLQKFIPEQVMTEGLSSSTNYY
jgi:hypothetical protein